MAKKVLRHGNRFPARVRRLYFFGGREATREIASAVRRLLNRQSKGKTEDYKKPRFHNTQHLLITVFLIFSEDVSFWLLVTTVSYPVCIALTIYLKLLTPPVTAWCCRCGTYLIQALRVRFIIYEFKNRTDNFTQSLLLQGSST